MNNIPVIFGKRGRTTIPQPLREKLGWQAGDTICFRLKRDSVIITRLSVKAKPKPRVLMLLIGGEGDE